MPLSIYSYKYGSASAKALAEALDVKRIKHDRSRFRGNQNKIVLNWGASEVPEEVAKCRVLNPAEEVKKASNKLEFFRTMQGASWLPAFTEERSEAARWLNAEGGAVVCRTILNGHSGTGIVLSESEEELVAAPLYVRYIKKKEEYRVHVFAEHFMGQLDSYEVFDIQRKARRLDAGPEEINWQIRNHQNGFIYQRDDVQCPQVVQQAAVECLARTGLDFGAVDVIYNDHNRKAYVLEINTAPGLSGTTIENYSNMIRSIV